VDGSSVIPSIASGVASIDTTSFTLSFIGNANPAIAAAELTGTGDGRLFAFYYPTTPTMTFLGELDKTTGQLLSSTPLSIDLSGAAFAFGFWGGDFYFFTSPSSGPTTVTRYRPSDGSYAAAGTLNDVVVGAGVSTCAPQ
jgi:hypothetical protein